MLTVLDFFLKNIQSVQQRTIRIFDTTYLHEKREGKNHPVIALLYFYITFFSYLFLY